MLRAMEYSKKEGHTTELTTIVTPSWMAEKERLHHGWQRRSGSIMDGREGAAPSWMAEKEWLHHGWQRRSGSIMDDREGAAPSWMVEELFNHAEIKRTHTEGLTLPCLSDSA